MKFSFLIIFCLFCGLIFTTSCSYLPSNSSRPLAQVRTVAGAKDVRFNEVFGVAVDNTGTVYFSDGDTGKIWKYFNNQTTLLTDKLDTPSGLAFDEKQNRLIVADAGTSTIKAVNLASGEVSLIAGIENQFGNQDGVAATATFNAPLDVAIGYNGAIFVADTYNYSLRAIHDGQVTTIRASNNNYYSPSAIAVAPNGDIVFSDLFSLSIYFLDNSVGDIKVLAGGRGDYKQDGEKDGLALNASFIEPMGIEIDKNGVIYVADAGANEIRVIGKRTFNTVETLTKNGRGLTDGDFSEARFLRPSHLAFDKNGTLFVADAGNQVLRAVSPENAEIGEKITPETVKDLRTNAEEMRKAGEPRWTFFPQDKPREIAGTFGEVRGEMPKPDDEARFHNGLDIAGGYGEAVYLLRSEKVLLPNAIENVNGDRELIRFPTIGYIHLRIGRDANNKFFDDARFKDISDPGYANVLIKRGTKFQAGEKIGTLNRYNHVHLIAGRAGYELNALAALEFPGIKDSKPPTIENVAIYSRNWEQISNEKGNASINVAGKIRVVVRAFDQMDGNRANRRLGVYRLGYETVSDAETRRRGDAPTNANKATNAISTTKEMKTTISFERLPDSDGVTHLAFAFGSQSGYTPDTVFNYIVTNEVGEGAARENFLDTTILPNGAYKLRVFAADFFNNQTVKEIEINVQN